MNKPKRPILSIPASKAEARHSDAITAARKAELDAILNGAKDG